MLQVIVLVMAAIMPGEQDYIVAREAEDAGQLETAKSYYEKVMANSETLLPYASIRLAACEAELGDRELALEQCERVLALYPTGPWVNMAKAQMAKINMDLGRHDTAAKLFDEALAETPRPWWFDDYEWDAAENQLEMPETRTKGFIYFRNVVLNSRRLDRRVAASKILAKSPVLEDQLAAAYGFVRSGEFKAAAEVVSSLSPEALETENLIANWQALTARIMVSQGRREEGQNLLKKVAASHPGTEWARYALYNAVRNSLSRDNLNEAKELCELIAEQYPGAEETGNALWRLASAYADAGQGSQAVATYTRLAEVAPNHYNAGDALLRASWIEFRQNHLDKAGEILEKLVNNHPDVGEMETASYWAGVIYDRLSDPERAHGHFLRAAAGDIGSFYAHRALEHLNAAGTSLPVGDPAYCLRTTVIAQTPEPALTDEMKQDPAYQRLTLFGDHGWIEGEWEGLGLLKKGWRYDVLSETGIAFSIMDRARATKWEGMQESPLVDRLRTEYPRAYWKLVKETADEAGIDPYLILAIARSESVFKARVQSHAGASGTMQVMPATAEWLAKVEPEVTDQHIQDLNKPINSFHIGTVYLKRLMEKTDNNIVFALAAYNAGPGNLSKWRKNYDTSDLDDFIESIPFTETRNYVKSVLGNYAAYHSLYPASGPSQDEPPEDA